MESKVQQSTDELTKMRKEKEQIQEELNEKERQANSQDLVGYLVTSIMFCAPNQICTSIQHHFVFNTSKAMFIQYD